MAMACAGRVLASQLVDNLRAGENQTVVVFGTSLTASGQWVTDTKNWLNGLNPGHASVTMINSGQSGKASGTGLAVLDSAVIAKRPDTVFIEFSVNDAFNAFAPGNIDYNISVAQGVANLNLMIDRIQAALPQTEIILQTMNPAWDAPNGNMSGSKRPNLAEYYDSYRALSVTRGLLLIDHNANWVALRNSNPALFQDYIPDGVHPSQTASTRITFAQIQQSLVATTIPEPSCCAFFVGLLALLPAGFYSRRKSG